MAQDVFISHAVEDKQVADRVCGALEDEGVGCWIAPRDIPPGRDYEEAIVEAIAASRVVLLILSAHSNSSPHVKREVQHAFAEGSQARVIPFRIEPVPYSKSLSYYLGSVQWIDAAAPPLEEPLRRLVRHVRAELATPASAEGVRETEPTESHFIPRQGDDGRGSRAPWLVAGVAAALLLVAVVGYFAFLSPNRRDHQRNANVTPATPTPNRATPTPSPTPSPSVTPTPTPTRTPIRNFNLRLPTNLRPANINRTRPPQ
jgi:hypothetical protein